MLSDLNLIDRELPCILETTEHVKRNYIPYRYVYYPRCSFTYASLIDQLTIRVPTVQKLRRFHDSEEMSRSHSVCKVS